MSKPEEGVPVSETLITVRSPELDSFGHVNHATFLNYLEHARYEALEAAGFPWSTLDKHGWQIFVVRIEVDYIREASRGDRLLVRTWSDGFRRTVMNLSQTIVRGSDPETLITRASVTTAWIGPDHRPMRVPAEVRVGLTKGPRP